MPPKRPTQQLISTEWAESLIGLSMKVPEYWWQGCKGYRLHDGKIDSFDIQTQKWNLLLDARDEPFPYLMAYDAVAMYADEDSSTIDEYQLPYKAILVGDDEIEAEDGTRYTRTATSEWTKVEVEDGKDDAGRRIEPIEWTGEKAEPVNITEEELNLLRDVKGEIRFEKVFDWILPRFGVDDSESLYDWQAARMRNYMTKKVVEDGWIPRFYHYEDVIQSHHVARYYGTCLARMLMGNRSINQVFCSREFFNAVPPIQASMTKNALEDLTSCLHYSDDWVPKNNDNWDDVYDDPKVVAEQSTASHRLKHGQLEDGYIKVCAVCCCCCCYYDSNRFLITFFPSFLSLLSSGGKLLSILENGLRLMRAELQAGITVP
jgi:hypothetical protein